MEHIDVVNGGRVRDDCIDVAVSRIGCQIYLDQYSNQIRCVPYASIYILINA